MAHKKNFLRGAIASVAGSLLAFTGLASMAQAADGAIIEPTADEKQINLIGYNDFHGRLSNMEGFAQTALCAADKYGDANTLFVGNGDQAGASEFASSLLKDEPTLEALQELGTNTSFTSGNHEFDAGQEDAERIRQSLGGTLLAANVTKADGSLLLDAYKIYDMDGVRVAVIGAVTLSTPSAVSPAGIEGLTFGDPVAAVNQYAAEIEAAGTADVIIASYHEGGPADGLDANAGNEAFASMANDTADSVDVIFNGHTHRTYSGDVNGRPVVQASQYGEAIGQVVLTLDADNNVTAAESSVISTTDAEGNPVACDTPLSADAQNRYDTIMGIVDNAIAEADVLGQEQVGTINEDITRAYTWENGAPVADDRLQASSLGVLVADSMHTWANGNTTGADLSIMNPGGLRADLDGDGVLTYADAQSVLPFTNTLSLVTLTGDQIKQVFEEQWQPEGASRPYLQLGVSSNVEYTYDSTRDKGDRITGITIDGEPMDMGAEYTLVMPSFLASGGDNFTTLAEGSMVDTGSIDLDAFIQYIESLPNQELKAPTARPGVETAGYFTEFGVGPVVEAGTDFTFEVLDYNLRSKNFIANETAKVMIDGEEVGEITFEGDTANGDTVTATVTLNNVQADMEGDKQLVIEFPDSGTMATLPITVEAPAATPDVTVSPEKLTAEQSQDGVTISGNGWEPGVEVTIDIAGPEGISKSFTVTPDENGSFEELITWATFDQDGNLIEDNKPFPVGVYTVTATQGDASATTEFEITGADQPTATPVPTTDAPAAGEQPGGKLPATGGDSTLLIGGLAVALIIAAAGTALVAQRRNA